MSSSSHKHTSPPYKKYQCRYFDEKGRPLHTPCNQGDRCRFVHPDDPNWPGLKCHPFPVRAGSYNTPLKKCGQMGNSRAVRAGGPLVSQTDLFRLECKVETVDDGTSLYGPQSYDENKSFVRDSDRSYAIEQDVVRSQDKETERSNIITAWMEKPRSELKTLSSDWQNDFNTKVGRALERSSSRDAVRSPRSPRSHSLFEKVNSADCGTKMTDVVRTIAKLSNQVVQDAVKHAESERNLNNFNEISGTLSKISASAAVAVATPLTNTILDHVRIQERMEANFTALEGEWRRFFETFTSEITGIIERSVEDSMTSLQREEDNVVQPFRESSSGKRKQIGGSSLIDEEQGRRKSGSGRSDSSRSRHDHSRSRELKRRKTSLEGCSPSPTRRDSEVLPRASKGSFDDMMNDIKGKLDHQNRALQWLQKENSELKQQLHEERGSRGHYVQPAGNGSKETRGTCSPDGWTCYR